MPIVAGGKKEVTKLFRDQGKVHVSSGAGGGKGSMEKGGNPVIMGEKGKT